MDLKIVLWYIGVSLLLTAGLMTVSGVMACYTPGDESRIPLFFSAFVTGIVGFYPLIFVRRERRKLTFREGNCVVVGSWVACCLFGMLPFLLYAHEFNFINSLFESVSGFTTTGASILKDIEALPTGLKFWRIATAWVGGIGIVTLFSMVMRGGMDKASLSGAEISNVTRAQFNGERSAFFGSKMLTVYICLTFLTFIALLLTGMSGFDSITNAMSACSTCGFCIRNESIAFYNSPAAETVLTFAMLASGINFSLLFLTFVKGSGKNIFKSEVTRTFLILVFVAIIAVTIDLMLNGGYKTFWAAIRDASFQVASLSTTTGFATKDTTLWPTFSIAILLICSLVCGCSGSTSGGIKFDRVYLALKNLKVSVMSAVSPRTIRMTKVDGTIRSAGQMSDVQTFLFTYLAIILVFSVINAAGGLDTVTAFTASVACIGNVGPGFGQVGSMANYSEIPDLLKFTSMIEMLLGRLEIFPILYLFKSFYTCR